MPLERRQLRKLKGDRFWPYLLLRPTPSLSFLSRMQNISQNLVGQIHSQIRLSIFCICYWLKKLRQWNLKSRSITSKLLLLYGRSSCHLNLSVFKIFSPRVFNVSWCVLWTSASASIIVTYTKCLPSRGLSYVIFILLVMYSK